MSEMHLMHLMQVIFTCSASGHLLKAKRKYKNVKKQEIPNIFIKTK